MKKVDPKASAERLRTARNATRYSVYNDLIEYRIKQRRSAISGELSLTERTEQLRQWRDAQIKRNSKP